MANQSSRPAFYDGSGNPDAWVDSFEHYANFAEWNEAKKLNAFKTMLQNRAARWLKELPPMEDDENEDEYEWLKAHFLEKFRPSGASQFRLRTELISTKQERH